MIAGIYARKSTPLEGAVWTGESVERQIEHARAYAERKAGRWPRDATSTTG